MYKILFITRACGLNYLADSIFHGLVSLGHTVIDTNEMTYMSKNTNLTKNKFTLYGKLKNRSNIDRSNIKQRILNKEFDFIFYGGQTKYLDYFDEVIKKYDSKHVIVLAGGDTGYYRSDLLKTTTIFCRECTKKLLNLYPIEYSIPAELFSLQKKQKKIRKLSLLIPGDNSTYIYKNEAEYYAQYAESYFALTMKKGGYDCLRHYEIILNNCLPVFLNYHLKPALCMFKWPTTLQNEANLLFQQQFNEQKYQSLVSKFRKYIFTNLTTTAMAQYIFNTIRA